MTRFAVYAGSLCFVFPLIGFFLWALSESFSVALAVSLLLAGIAEHWLMQSAAQRQRCVGAKQLESWLKEFPDARLIRRTVTEYGLNSAAQRLLTKGFGMGGLDLELYQVVCPKPPLPGAVKAFAFGTKCMVFLRDPPGTLTPYARFLVYHEVGHAFPTTPAFHTVEHNSLALLPLLGVVVWTQSSFDALAITAFVFYAVLRVWFFHSGRSSQLAELAADQFASFFLCREIDLKEIARLLSKFDRSSRATAERVERLNKYAADPQSCLVPDLPEIPLWVGIAAMCSLSLMATACQFYELGLVNWLMCGVALAHYLLTKYLATVR